MNALATALQFGELTVREIVMDIPHDICAVFVLLIVGGLLLLVWYGSRPEVIARFGAGRITPPPTPRGSNTDPESRNPLD